MAMRCSIVQEEQLGKETKLLVKLVRLGHRLLQINRHVSSVVVALFRSTKRIQAQHLIKRNVTNALQASSVQITMRIR